MLRAAFTSARQTVQRALADRSGATAIEYALLASLIAVAAIGGLQATGTSVTDMMSGVSNKVSAALAD